MVSNRDVAHFKVSSLEIEWMALRKRLQNSPDCTWLLWKSSVSQSCFCHLLYCLWLYIKRELTLEMQSWISLSENATWSSLYKLVKTVAAVLWKRVHVLHLYGKPKQPKSARKYVILDVLSSQDSSKALSISVNAVPKMLSLKLHLLLEKKLCNKM